MKRRPIILTCLVIGLGLILSLLVVVFKNQQIINKSLESDSVQETSGQSSGLVRKSAVAGQFYPSDKQTLSDDLDGYLQNVETSNEQDKPRILIVPHAGLSYSGQTAGEAFAQLKGREYKKVIIVSANHQVATSHASIYTTGVWQTLLGDVSVNEAYSSILIDEKNNVQKDLAAFAGDHTIEIELLFLQRVLDNFTIIPILLGQVNEATVDSLAQSIANIFDDETLLVVSTDLSHYPNWEDAKNVDELTINSILSGNRDHFHDEVTLASNIGIANLETRACGAKAVEVGLGFAKLTGITDFQLIDYSNSGDITGDLSRVVGYAAIVGSKDQISEAELDDDARREALEIARSTLEAYLETKQIPNVKPRNRYLFQPLGAFVTLEKNEDLRGCIGRFEPMDPLYKVIQVVAVDAAIHDRRFQPVNAKELDNLDIEISVMTPRRTIESWNEIELGKHGVVLQKGNRSGTFLPQVATDTGWSKEEFLGELCQQKAGLPKDCYMDPSVTISVFDAIVFGELESVGDGR